MKVIENVSLRQYNTFNLDATARYFAAFHSREALEEILSSTRITKMRAQTDPGRRQQHPAHEGFRRLPLLKNEIKGIHAVSEDEEEMYPLKRERGENQHQFVSALH